MPRGHGLSDNPFIGCQREGERQQPGHVVVLHLKFAAANHTRTEQLKPIGLGERVVLQRRDQPLRQQVSNSDSG